MITWVAAILALLAALATLAIGLIVWFGDRKNYLRIPFLWLAIFVAGWIASNVLFATGPVANQFPLALFSYAMAMLVATQTFLFVMRLVKRPLSGPVLFVIVAGYIAAIASAVPGSVGIAVEGGNIITHMVGIAVYGVFLSAYLLGACITLFMRLRRASRDLHRQIKLILYGVIASSIIGVTFNLILPILGNYQLTQLGPAGAIFFVSGVAYAVARYGLFDVRLAIVRAVTYALSLISLAGIYVLVAYVFFNQILGLTSTISQTLLNVGLTLLLAFLFQPIKQFFDHLTNKIFYKDDYSANDFQAELNKVLSSTTDLRTLLKRTSDIIARTFKSEQVLFFVYTHKKSFIMAGTDGHSKLPVADANELRFFKNIVLAGSTEVQYSIRRMMMSHKLALAMPLLRDQELIGYLLLGDHKTSIYYSRRDQRMLQTIADELVIAIQNALSLEEVKDLNANLEQKIASATKELRASNAQLHKLDESKDEFISMASHQLRTPLTSIKGYISMLMDGDVGAVTKEQKHLLEEAFMSSERMVRLIGDFLNVSRLQTGKFVMDKHPVDLAKLVGQEVQALEQNAEAHGMQFVYKKPKNIPVMNLDEGKLQQVIMNFCDNAMYYSKEGSKIKVELKLAAGCIEFTVKDTGIGVPAAEQAQLFNKFFRATNARSQRPDGTGVGLFLAKRVIDGHDGKIIFESKEGKGSTFGFRLPVKD